MARLPSAGAVGRRPICPGANSTLVAFLNRMPTFTSWLETALGLVSTGKHWRAGLPGLKGSQMPGTTLRILSNECPSHAVRQLMRESLEGECQEQTSTVY